MDLYSSSSKSKYEQPLEEKAVFEMKHDYFPYDPDVTDFSLIVKGKTFHVIKAVLMEASPEFRRMFTSDFKEKNVKELELPGKDVSSFEFFLRCIFPREYTLTDERVGEILPLADEYGVKSILQKCEDWLITTLELKGAQELFPTINIRKENMAYLIKCLYYGDKYNLKQLIQTAIKILASYNFWLYQQHEHYQFLSEKTKCHLFEARLHKIESKPFDIVDDDF